ncbi:hypothetical protein Tco_0841671 [Tanacetum coccineum]|uniref:Uncharacterized protein n=1 Tax=Tanacetum coccineum TaxID=301880 RepID=A0ABQ5B2P9_9ASTR
MVARLGTIRLHNSMVRLMMLLRLDHVTKNTNVVGAHRERGASSGCRCTEVSASEEEEWTVGQASLTKGVVSTCSTLVVGRNRITVVDVSMLQTLLVRLMIKWPYVLTKANLRKLEVNVSIDVDYDVWLPLASVHEVNDRMKNLFYRYFTGKRLAFPLWNGLCATIRKSMDSKNYLFEALSVENIDIDGNKATTSGTLEEWKSSTFLVERINVFEKQMLEGKLVLVDDDENPFEKVDFLGNTGSKDEVEPVDNETESYLASKPMGVGYGMKSLLEE